MRPISITRTPELHQDDHDRTAGGGLEARSRRTGLTNRDRPSYRIAIGRCRDEVEEPRDRLVIAARSSRDRGGIEPQSHARFRGIDSTRADEDR